LPDEIIIHEPPRECNRFVTGTGSGKAAAGNKSIVRPARL